jgi:multiple sugar transport system ATP-binding protein
MEIRRVPKEERDKAIKDVAETLQIGHLLDRKPSQLSGGQRQRVAMGRALVRRPQVFLFDEPLSNLDAKLRVDMRTEIKRLHQRLKRTIVYVTHDQIEAMTLATKIAVLKDGILQQAGTPAEIYNSPGNMFVADFMGSPAMNLIPATVEIKGKKARLVMPAAKDKSVTLDLASAPAGGARPVIFGIRPEAITDIDGADRTSGAIATADCMIEVVEPAGSDTFAVTHLGGKEAIARLRADAKVQAGKVAKLAFNLDKAVYFDPETQLRLA